MCIRLKNTNAIIFITMRIRCLKKKEITWNIQTLLYKIKFPFVLSDKHAVRYLYIPRNYITKTKTKYIFISYLCKVKLTLMDLWRSLPNVVVLYNTYYLSLRNWRHQNTPSFVLTQADTQQPTRSLLYNYLGMSWTLASQNLGFPLGRCR